MKFDLDTELASHAVKRERERGAGVMRELTDLPRERKLLGAFLADAPFCTCCPDEFDATARERGAGIEVDDFADLRHRLVLGAIRNLESRACSSALLDVHDEIERTHGRGSVASTSVDLVFLVGLIHEPGHSREGFAHSCARLRELANLRRLV